MARFKYYKYGTTKDVKLPKIGWVRSEKDASGKYLTIEIYDRIIRDADVKKYHLVDLNEPTSKLTKYRSSAGITQNQLAEILGIPRRTVQTWEKNGVNKAAFDSVVKLASVLKCNVMDLYEEEN